MKILTFSVFSVGSVVVNFFSFFSTFSFFFAFLRLCAFAFNSFFLGLVLYGCSSTQQPELKTTHTHIIYGRNSTVTPLRSAIYRAQAPTHWIRNDFQADEIISDTTKPLVEFFIIDNDEKIRITIHNFPSEAQQDRIPAEAQINRWKKQFYVLDEGISQTIPQAFGGFSGLFLDATGLMNHEKVSLLGWSMLLGPEYYQNLGYSILKAGSMSLLKQIRADYTIKAIGPRDSIDKNRKAIIKFARSFELIEELPSNS